MTKFAAVLALAAAVGVPSRAHTASAQATVPFVRDGEELVFNVRSSRFGDIGTATMKVVMDTAEGRPAYRLSFDFSARVMLFKVSDRTRSWVDTRTLTTLRYSKTERSPVAKRNEDAHMNLAANSWTDATGTHALASQVPLDELAFIYFVRMIAGEVQAGSPMVVKRHFDAGRNPVLLESKGTVRVRALGDSLSARVIQMDAQDTRSKKGKTRITFYIGDDAARLPLRMDTSMPVAGTLTMTLRSVSMHGRVVAGGVGGQRTEGRANQDDKSAGDRQ
ncbi:MAG: DUF3108 domain-containing protein [Longimicrobiales bacterium]